MARPRNQPDDPLVAQILNETKAGEDQQRQRVKQYDRAYEVYRASSPRPPSLESWRSYLRGKYAMAKIDTAMVNIAQGEPRFKAVPRRPDSAPKAKVFSRALDYYVDEDDLVTKYPLTAQQALIYGVHVGKTNWLYQKGMGVRKQFDPLTGDPYPVQYEIVKADRPNYEPWDVYDAWWDPNARDVQSAEYVALRSWVSKSYLESNRCTVEKQHDPAECNGLYHNLDALYETGTGQRRSSTAQDRLLGGDQNLRKDRFALVEYWRNERLTVVGNSKILLRDQPNPHWHGEKPIVIASCRPDLFKVQGIPETELIDDFQQALWTVENMRMESWYLTTWRGFTYRETIPDPNKIEIKPRALIPVSDHDDLAPIQVEPLPPEAYQEEQMLLARMDDVTGITPYTTGAALGSVNQNTATGISILNNAASRLLQFKASQIYQGVWRPVAQQWGQDIQQYLTDPIWARVTGPGGEEQFHYVTPADVAGEYDFKLVATEESLSKAQERQDALGLLQAFAPFAQLGIINWQPILEKVAQAFNFDNAEELLNPIPQQQAAAPFPQGGQPPPQQQQMPQGMPATGQTLTNGNALPALVHRAVMQGGQG